MIAIKNWTKFQHFKDRRPPWVKLYRDILDDLEWHELDPEAAKVLVMLWLIASENDGRLPENKQLAFRLRMAESKLKTIISKLSHWLEQDDINAISAGYQSDAPERETETEGEQISTRPTRNTPEPKKRKTPLPENFGVSDQVKAWAAEKGFADLDRHLESFKDKCQANGYTYVNWDAAFMEAIRGDWAKLRQTNTSTKLQTVHSKAWEGAI
ncbi:hypothetical protein PSQ20_21785 [Curvibacter sp. RS43]|uniref:hypothetical protein n=1 Tax=Curvibacter microcysteis TaxID=3026419 RepID=UPI00235F615A|nr:hypothetical protein [Curvibacter sp. RS43]MDD0812982.1 hypothetical protein [Curvibacter sp. RS43]